MSNETAERSRGMKVELPYELIERLDTIRKSQTSSRPDIIGAYMMVNGVMTPNNDPEAQQVRRLGDYRDSGI